MKNKHILTIACLMVITSISWSQKTSIQFQFEGFKEGDRMKLELHNGESFQLDPLTNEQNIELNISEPTRGIIYLRKSKSFFLQYKWKEFFIDPGQTTIKTERRRFRNKTKISGSPSNAMFQSYLKGSQKIRSQLALEYNDHPFFNSCEKNHP